MKERPIIFNSEMVRAILDGRKTQTRRVCGEYLQCYDSVLWDHNKTEFDFHFKDGVGQVVDCPLGQVGDRLWVKETWAECNCEENNCPGVIYKNHLGAMNVKRWKPSIHMPKWASRITLEITDVRVERVQDISNQDVAFEGIPHIYYPQEISKSDPHYAFEKMFVDYWNSTAKEGFKWKDNPWVWVIEFERIET